MTASHALSQLSYGPKKWPKSILNSQVKIKTFLMDQGDLCSSDEIAVQSHDVDVYPGRQGGAVGVFSIPEIELKAALVVLCLLPDLVSRCPENHNTDHTG